MTVRPSDALQALIGEVVEQQARVAEHRDTEEAARQEFVAARQALDAATARTKAADARLEATDAALALIARRDDISDETLDALTERARR